MDKLLMIFGLVVALAQVNMIYIIAPNLSYFVHNPVIKINGHARYIGLKVGNNLPMKSINWGDV